MGVERDIWEIGEILASAQLLTAVRREVVKVRREGFIVTDGQHHPEGAGYDVVVSGIRSERHAVARRLRAGIPDVDVESISAGVLGVRKSRRGRSLNGI